MYDTVFNKTGICSINIDVSNNKILEGFKILHWRTMENVKYSYKESNEGVSEHIEEKTILIGSILREMIT